MTLARIDVRLEPSYPVVVGPGALAELGAWIDDASARAIVTDTNVAEHWLGALSRWSDAALTILPAGEGAKSFETLALLCERFAEARLDRAAVVVALGGGVVGDLAGLAASLYMRGIAVVQAPTTLLAQVDAAIGGKTAVNLAAGRNLAGTFHQPRAVVADSAPLGTLPDAEWRSGLGEVVKTALVAGRELLALVEERADVLLEREPAALAEIVTACVRTKASIVADDPRERGPRRALNLGHTFAHAIEAVAGPGRVPHGVAVGVGCVLAARAAAAVGLGDEGTEARIVRLLERLGLPSGLDELRARHGVALPPVDVLAAMSVDKKGSAGRPRFVLPRAPGELELRVELDESVLLAPGLLRPAD